MKKLRNILLTGLLLLLAPLVAMAAVNSWSGTGPYATGLGNQIVNALSLSPDGQTVYAGTGSGTVLSYEIVPAPTVTAISPTSGPIAGGTAVTITGTNLTGASAVTIGGAAATGVTVVNATTLTATTPSGSVGAQNVVVTTPGGSGTGTGLFTYVAVLAAPQMDLKQGVTSIADGGSHGFGSKMVSSNTDTVFTIENSGTGALNVTTPISIGGANADQFSIQAQPVSPVAPSGSTTFTVRFTPTTAGAKTASISIANNDATKNPYDVTLTGTGTPTTFSLSYDGNGQTSGSAPSDATAYASGASATVLGNTGSLVKTGNTFVGWNLASNASGTHYAVGSSYTITSNTTLYAQWLGTPSATAASSVTLTGFTANWGSVAGATGYRLDVATDSGFGSMVVGFNDLDVGGLTSQALTGLPSGTTYHYRVRAYNGASSSASSNTISVTTGSSRIVTNTDDSGTGSLRQTISAANPGDTVTFAAGVTGTITLTAPLSITKDLTITGPGAAVLAVSGNNAVRIFQIPGANSLTLQNLTLSNGAAVGGAALADSVGAITTISGCVFSGNSALSGGAILSSGTLTISDSTFSGNSASTLFGGAISASGGGTVAISNTLFSGNSAPAGGAIANGSTSMTLTNVTLSGNTGGGAIYASGGSTLNALNATVANNSTPGNGGGILAASGALVNLKNTLVANNAATASGPDIAGAITSQGYNLFGSTAGATIGGDTTGNLTSGTPLLGALANNGGTTQTLALLAGSPALNAGTCTGAPATDQRGMARPPTSACDIGAYERGAPAALTATAGTPQITPISSAFATALAATVVDSLGAALDGESITFAGPGSGASIAAGGSATTNAAGVASFSATANGVGGSYTVTATINALSASFSLTNSTSNNANLSALALSSGTLAPAFAPATTSYSATVANAVASITATPTVADGTASVKVNGVAVASGSASGAIALSVGANTITVLVTAQDASTKTTTVVVTRASPPDTTPPTLSAVGVSGTGETYTTLSATSDEAATGYWMVVARSATAPTSAQVRAGVAYAGVSVVAFGTGTMTAALAKTFAVGGLAASTHYDLYVAAQDGSANLSTPPSLVPLTTQSVAISGNANLSALSLSSGTLAPAFAQTTTSYSATVANAVASITATPTVADGTASVKVNGVTVVGGSASGAIALSVGANTITVMVTAQNNSTKTYTVVVSRSSPPGTYIPGLIPSIAGVTCLPNILDMAAGDGPGLIAGMVGVLSQTEGVPLRFVGQTSTGAVVLTGYPGVDLSFMPTAYQNGDLRANGVYGQGDGQYQIVVAGTAVTVVPALVSLEQFTSVLPAGAPTCMGDAGVLLVTLGGVGYAVRPGIAVQRLDNPGAPSLVLGEDGYYHFTDSAGRRQTLYPAILEPHTLLTYLRTLDPAASMRVQLDGTVLVSIHGVNYTLVPDLTLGGIPTGHVGQHWWQEGPNRYRMRNQRQLDSTQGFTVR